MNWEGDYGKKMEKVSIEIPKQGVFWSPIQISTKKPWISCIDKK